MIPGSMIIGILGFQSIFKSFTVLQVGRHSAFMTTSSRRDPAVWRLASAEAETATAKGTADDKMTKEAMELLDVFQAKECGDEGAFKLIMAQVAPSVRYVRKLNLLSLLHESLRLLIFISNASPLYFRVAISEEFGLEPGQFTPGQLVASLKRLGFDLVLDTNTAADITICEEGTELWARLQARDKNQVSFGKGDPAPQPLPLFTSCCPGWMLYIEKSEPELSPYISSCKSPHMMYGALIKHYCNELLGEKPGKVYLTSVMPCVRKRGESDRECFANDGLRDVDNVVTTQDLGQMLRKKGINPAELEPLPFDSPFQMDGTGSGAGQLFGATGGVMEAAVRSVYEIVTGTPLPTLELDEVRGLEGVKEATISFDGKEFSGGPVNLKVAVCSGLGNAKQLIKKMKDGDASYDFVEVMACPGGCIAGGGQPKGGKDAVEKRLDCIYNLDRDKTIRRSHENPTVKAFYDAKYLGGFGSEKAHELLHVDPVYKDSKKDE